MAITVKVKSLLIVCDAKQRTITSENRFKRSIDLEYHTLLIEPNYNYLIQEKL